MLGVPNSSICQKLQENIYCGSASILLRGIDKFPIYSAVTRKARRLVISLLPKKLHEIIAFAVFFQAEKIRRGFKDIFPISHIYIGS